MELWRIWGEYNYDKDVTNVFIFNIWRFNDEFRDERIRYETWRNEADEITYYFLRHIPYPLFAASTKQTNKQTTKQK